MVYKRNKGITIISLIITIIIMLILTAVTVNIGTGQIERTKLEDLKTTMLLIKGRAQIVADKEVFGENYDSTGMLNLVDATEYNISNLQNIFNDIDTSGLFIWEQTAMDNNSIDVEITKDDFFVVDYETGEVYYSLGFTYEDNTYYSLTELQNI